MTDAPTEPSKALDEARRILAEMVHWKVGDFYDGTGAAKLADALDRFRAAGVWEWQPIETAPKDGSRVLAISRKYGNETRIVRWDGEDWRCIPGNIWRICPTHWMPLPGPPHD